MVRLIELQIKPDQGVLGGFLDRLFQPTGDDGAARLKHARVRTRAAADFHRIAAAFSETWGNPARLADAREHAR